MLWNLGGCCSLTNLYILRYDELGDVSFQEFIGLVLLCLTLHPLASLPITFQLTRIRIQGLVVFPLLPRYRGHLEIEWLLLEPLLANRHEAGEDCAHGVDQLLVAIDDGST